MQVLRPESTVTATGFTGGSADVDEATASDADFAWGANNTAAVLEVALSDPAGTPGSGTCTLRYRIAKTNSGVVDGAGNAVTITGTVLQGAATIATDSARTATGTWTEYTLTFAASAVTDWMDLRVRLTTSASGGNPSSRRGGAVSWVALEAPDAVTAISGSGSGSTSQGGSGAGSLTIDGDAGGVMPHAGAGTGTATLSGVSVVQYHVNTDGSNGDGSLATPWSSMENARAGLAALYPSGIGVADVSVDVFFAGATEDTAPVSATGVNWGGLGGDATHQIRLLPEPGQRARMPFDTGRYRLVQAGTVPALTLASPYIVLGALQIRNTASLTGTNTVGVAIDNAAGTVSILDGTLVEMTGTGTPATDQMAVRLLGAGSTQQVVLRNAVMRGGRIGFRRYSAAAGATTIVDNCTFVEQVNFGLYLGSIPGTTIVRNNVADSGGTDFTIPSGATHSGNRSSDASSPDAAGRNQTFTFVSPGTGDYHLAAGDTGARNAGTNLTADADDPFADDFDGDARPSSGAWDSGADQTVSAGVTGAGSGSAAHSGTGTGAESIAGAGSGTAAHQGSGAGTERISGTATGSAAHAGSGAGSETITGTAAGSAAHAGSGTGTEAIAGSGSGAVAHQGAGAGAETITGSGSGSATHQGAGTGPAVGVTGSGAGATDHQGTGAATETIAGTGAGLAAHAGAGLASETITGSGAGSVAHQGAGSGADTITGLGSGAVVHQGIGAASEIISGMGSGSAGHTGSGQEAVLRALYALCTSGPMLRVTSTSGPQLRAITTSGPRVTATRSP